MLAQLGAYIFDGLQSPTSMNTSSSARYGQISLVNAKDVLQKTGDELDEVTFTMQLSIEFCDPAVVIAGMKEAMANAEVLPFIMGDGTIVGKFVLTSIEVVHEKLASDGFLESAQATVSLLEFAGGEEITVSGSALKSANPVVEETALPVETPADTITKEINRATSDVNQMSGIMAETQPDEVEYLQRVGEIKGLALHAQKSYQSAQRELEASDVLSERAKELGTALQEAMNATKNLTEITTDTIRELVEMWVETLEECAEKVKMHAIPVVAFLITKEGGT